MVGEASINLELCASGSSSGVGTGSVRGSGSGGSGSGGVSKAGGNRRRVRASGSPKGRMNVAIKTKMSLAQGSAPGLRPRAPPALLQAPLLQVYGTLECVLQ